MLEKLHEGINILDYKEIYNFANENEVNGFISNLTVEQILKMLSCMYIQAEIKEPKKEKHKDSEKTRISFMLDLVVSNSKELIDFLQLHLASKWFTGGYYLGFKEANKDTTKEQLSDAVNIE